MSHSELQELLPWYANGTLDGEESVRVEAHLAECADCALELTQLEKLSTLATEMAAAMPEPTSDPLARALASISSADDYDSAPAAPPQLGASQRLIEWWASWWQPMPPLARALVAVQSMLLVVAVGVAASLWSPADRWTTAGAGPDSVSTDATRLLIGFQPDASADEIAALIRALDGNVVAGPSSIGLYTVAVPPPAGGVAALDSVVAELRAQTTIVLLAEIER